MSKLLLKISGIVSLCYAGLYLFVFIISHMFVSVLMFDKVSDYLLIVLIGIFALIAAFGGFLLLHYKDLDDDELKMKKNCILIWSIILFLTTGLGGITSLMVYLVLINPFTFSHKNNYINELEELQNLMDDGLISKEEFDKKKKIILNI